MSQSSVASKVKKKKKKKQETDVYFVLCVLKMVTIFLGMEVVLTGVLHVSFVMM